MTEQIAASAESSTSYLSRQETRQILTPFAFEIDKSLFGLPLARPWKRLFSLLFDLMIIAMLSEAPGELLAIVIAVLFFRYFGKKRRSGGRFKSFLRIIGRFFAALVIFVALMSWLPSLFNNDLFDSDSKASSPGIVNVSNTNDVVLAGNDLSMKQSIAVTALTVATVTKVSQSDCQSVDCWQHEFKEVLSGLAQLNVELKVAKDAIAAVAEATELPGEQQQLLKDTLVEEYQVLIAEQPANKSSKQDEKKLDSQQLQEKIKSQVAEKKGAIGAGPEFVSPKKTESNDPEPIVSIIEYIKKLIEDLGLGFGWAAVYFTFFTAFWRGQTPGKKLLGIKVLQLDGTPLSLMDSFGRYGGYGAGIATGLLGFAQVFWDANRQAIHDKISATVVVDLRVISDVPGSHSVNEHKEGVDV